MGSLVLKNLQNIDKVSPDYTYLDLHLDIEDAVNLTAGGRVSPKSRDIRVDYDEAAIKNSIVNIFNTIPGERFLVPEFGANLRGYLFKSVTETTANEIGRTILNAIERWEPRVVVEQVRVVGVPFGSVTSKNTGKFNGLVNTFQMPITEDEYDVTVIISIPPLKRRTNLLGVLTVNGFAEVRNSTI